MESSMRDIKSTGNGISATAKEKAKEALKAVPKQLENLDIEKYYSAVKNKTKEVVDASTGFVKRHPVYTLLGLSAVGFILGLTFRRR